MDQMWARVKCKCEDFLRQAKSQAGFFSRAGAGQIMQDQKRLDTRGVIAYKCFHDFVRPQESVGLYLLSVYSAYILCGGENVTANSQDCR
jgi:hypothetical protein